MPHRNTPARKRAAAQSKRRAAIASTATGSSAAFLPLGAMLCICELREVYRTEDVAHLLSEQERALGDFTPGRAAWLVKVVEVFERPIPMRGQQGLWEWTR